MTIKTLYLAHQFPRRREIRKWELDFEKRTGINLTNPFYDRDRKDIKAIDNGLLQPYDLERNWKEIVEGDLKAIDNSDGVLAFHRHRTPTIGTAMEIIYAAFIAEKPTYIVTDAPGHPWLIYMANRSGGFIVGTLLQFEKRFLAMRDPTDILEPCRLHNKRLCACRNKEAASK